MDIVATSERIDHLGVVAGVIKDLKLVELIDERIPTDSREEISRPFRTLGSRYLL